MSKYLSFRDGGKTSESGISKPFADIFTGSVKAGFTTTQLGSPGMGVAVAEGSAFIDTGNGYPYHVYSDAAENVTITTADGSNPRWDVIVAYVDLTEVDDTDPNNPDAFKLVAVAGTPAGSPAEPNGAAIQSAIGASNPYILLARVVVGTGVTTITNANITDRRTMVTTNVNAGTNKVVTASVADSAVTTAKINDGAVTPDKMNFGAQSAVVATSQTETSTSWDDMTTPGPSVTVVAPIGGTILLLWGAQVANSTPGVRVGIGVRQDAADPAATDSGPMVLSFRNTLATTQDVTKSRLVTGLTPGQSYTFKLRYTVQNNTGTFENRYITAIPIGD